MRTVWGFVYIPLVYYTLRTIIFALFTLIAASKIPKIVCYFHPINSIEICKNKCDFVTVRVSFRVTFRIGVRVSFRVRVSVRVSFRVSFRVSVRVSVRVRVRVSVRVSFRVSIRVSVMATKQMKTINLRKNITLPLPLIHF